MNDAYIPDFSISPRITAFITEKSAMADHIWKEKGNHLPLNS